MKQIDFLTAARFCDTRQWREAVQLDAAMADPLYLAKERAMRALLHFDFLGLDQFGRPVSVERVGAWDVKEIVAAATADAPGILMSHAIAIETLIRWKRPNNCRDPRGMVFIVDAKGISSRLLNRKLLKVFGSIAKIDAAHFPDLLAHVFVVNAPTVFTAIGAAVRPFVTNQTMGKVVLSSKVPPQLVEALGAEVLPIELGGTRKNCFPYDLNASACEQPLAPSANAVHSGEAPMLSPPCLLPTDSLLRELGAPEQVEAAWAKPTRSARKFVSHVNWPPGVPPFVSHVEWPPLSTERGLLDTNVTLEGIAVALPPRVFGGTL